MRPILLAIAVIYTFSACSNATDTNISRDNKDSTLKAANLAAWQHDRFGLFVHWGLYSIPAGEWKGQRGKYNVWNCWFMRGARVPVAEYAKLAGQFNPVRFDANALAGLAKRAGMKYLVATAKHHDGFAMYDSKASDYNIVAATPFKRDVIREIAAACTKNGLPLGLYYSQAQDWYHPGGATNGNWDSAQRGSMDKYIDEIAVPQVHELLSNYGTIRMFWWDTPKDMTVQRTAKLQPLLKLQEGIFTNNRLGRVAGADVSGDFTTPEQRLPFRGLKGQLWEACMTINDSWGYNSADHNWKSGETLIRNLVDVVSKGGNYLLNVAPNALGEIPAPCIERLEMMGDWLSVNGEAIYGATAGPFEHQLHWGRFTQKPGKLFTHVFFWPGNGQLTIPVTGTITKAYLLAKPGESLPFTSSAAGVQLRLPAKAPDAIASVIVLETKGTVTALPAPPVAQAADGIVRLPALDVEPIGLDLAIEGYATPALRFWKSTKGHLEWTAEITRRGTYAVKVMYSVRSDCQGSEIELSCADQSLRVTAAGTEGSKVDWNDFQPLSFGKITITKPGRTTIKMRIAKAAGKSERYGAMNIRYVELKPL